jgi:drug/metabolite transporter (DMT)-like permease
VEPTRSATQSSALSPQDSLKIHLVLATAAFLFSINYIISKFAMGVFSPLSFAYTRVLGSALLMQLVVRGDRSAPLSREDSKRVFGYAILGVVINQTFFLGGLSLTSAHVAAILITTIPVFALGAAIILGREVPTAAKIGGIALAAAGALLVVAGEGFEGAGKSWIGDLLIVCNSLSYALYLVLSKPAMARLSARRVIARMFAIGAIAMLPICAWSLAHEKWSAIPFRAWLALAAVIVGPTVGAYLLNAWALRHADSSLVAAYSYLQPVIAVVLAAIFLREEIRPIALVAAAMIFTGVYVSGRRSTIV